MPSDPSFERSADMRLLDLQRSQLGMSPRSAVWQSDLELEPISSVVEEVAPKVRGAIICLDSVAVPTRNLIPGARVTLTLLARNDGTQSAAKVTIRLPLPDALDVEPDGLTVDGNPAQSGGIDALFGTGLILGAIEPDGHRLIKLRVRVRPGTKTIVASPSLDAPGSAVVGGRALRLERAARGAYQKPPEPPKGTLRETPAAPADQPFYELDDDEAVEHEALATALGRRVIDLTEPLVEIVDREPAPAAAPARPMITIIELPAPVSLGEGILARSPLDITSLAFVRRLLGEGQRWGLLAHFLFVNAFACTLSRDFAESLAKQNTALQRALLLRQLKKSAPLADYHIPHQIMWKSLREKIAPITSADITAGSMRRTLYRIVDIPHIEGLAQLGGDPNAGDFVRSRRMTLRLFPTSIGGVDDAAARERLEKALSTYVDAFENVLNRLMIRAKLEKSTKILESTHADLGEAAAAILDSLEAIANA